MPTYTQTITGTSGDDAMLTGTDGNDYIHSVGGEDNSDAGAGDDYVFFQGLGGDLSGGAGDDILQAKKMGAGQYHMYGASGDDLMLMDLTNKDGWGHTAYHAYGAFGNDTFSFSNLQGVEVDTTARMDDFNASRDKLVIEGQVIDLAHVPAGMRVVSYLGQQWLHIDNDTSVGNSDPLKGDVMISLDGARQMSDREEVHFSPFPADADALPTITYVNDNYVPYELYSARESSLKKITSDSDSVTGTEGADYIYGYKDPHLPVGMTSTISALGGDDVVEAGSGHDTVDGGAGNDLLSGGLDIDNLLGGTGNDLLLGGSEDDRLEGQSGNDSLDGGRGLDEAVFSGSRSSYTITTSGGVTTVVDNRAGTPDGTDTVKNVEQLRFADQVVDLGGNVGPKIFTGNTSDNIATGSNFVDEMYGRGGNDTLSGIGGNDKLYGEGGNDRLDGGAGDDLLVGGGGHDTFIVDSRGDVVTELLGSGTGTDTILTTLSSTDLRALAAIENVTYQGTGDFTGTGNGLLNTLTGGAGSDVLDGGANKDTLKGGAGADSLLGGTGADLLAGGTGADDFVFVASNDSLTGQKDTLLDFARGEDDLVVTTMDANTALAGDQAFVLDTGGTFAAGEIRQRVSGGDLLVEFNTDADANVEMTLLLKGVTTPLAASDFEF